MTIVLDTSPLSIVTKRREVAEADACRAWVAACRHAGHQIIAPATARYEIARELERIRNTAGLACLDAYCAVPGCYLPMTDSAFRLAATLWAQARNAGTPTANARELDCDVLIAAQALELQTPVSTLVVATMNVGHLSRFVTAELWTNIQP